MSIRHKSRAYASNKTVTTGYTYKTNGSNQTERVGSLSYTKTDNGNTSYFYVTISYDYDANGNITRVYDNGVEKIRYYYDELNRMTREDNVHLNSTYVYTYDTRGNILSKKTYAHTTSTLPATPQSTYSYSYNSSAWKDGVTQFNGSSITYNAAGNPVNQQ